MVAFGSAPGTLPVYMEERLATLEGILADVRNGDLELVPLRAAHSTPDPAALLTGAPVPKVELPVPTREQLSLGWIFRHAPISWWVAIAVLLWALVRGTREVDDWLEAREAQAPGVQAAVAAAPEPTPADELTLLLGEGWVLREPLAAGWSDGRAQEARAWSESVHRHLGEHEPASAERFLSDEGLQLVADPAAPLRDRTLLDLDHRLRRLREVLVQL